MTVFYVGQKMFQDTVNDVDFGSVQVVTNYSIHTQNAQTMTERQ